MEFRKVKISKADYTKGVASITCDQQSVSWGVEKSGAAKPRSRPDPQPTTEPYILSTMENPFTGRPVSVAQANEVGAVATGGIAAWTYGRKGRCTGSRMKAIRSVFKRYACFKPNHSDTFHTSTATKVISTTQGLDGEDEHGTNMRGLVDDVYRVFGI